MSHRRANNANMINITIFFLILRFTYDTFFGVTAEVWFVSSVYCFKGNLQSQMRLSGG